MIAFQRLKWDLRKDLAYYSYSKTEPRWTHLDETCPVSVPGSYKKGNWGNHIPFIKNQQIEFSNFQRK